MLLGMFADPMADFGFYMLLIAWGVIWFFKKAAKTAVGQEAGAIRSELKAMKAQRRTIRFCAFGPGA